MAARWLIVGSTAAGKTTTGRALAERLGLPFADLDQLMEDVTGRSLRELFEEMGEAAFRPFETGLAVAELQHRVGLLALGGGTFASAWVRAAARRHGWITVYLRLQPAAAARRLTDDPGGRPGCDAKDDLLALLAARFAARDSDYATADIVVDCDDLSVEETVLRVLAEAPLGAAASAVAWLDGGPKELADLLASQVPTGRILCIADSALRGEVEKVVHSLLQMGRQSRIVWVEAGESAKTADALARVWNEAFRGPLDRGDTVVTIGGGVVSDLGGFAAATLLRGLPVLHVTTTLMGMVDAAIGGKTGVDLPVGKNLIGAFHQPRAVIQWGSALSTLPDREFRAGLAEVVKCALLRGEAEFAGLEADAAALLAREPEAVARAVALATGTKTEIVSRDPLERGERALLNLGHTFGHALEAATGYERFLHGEAVAVGLVAALRFGLSLGITEVQLPARVASLLAVLGLPTEPPSIAPEIWRDGLSRDKKRTADAVRFVFCRQPGWCETQVVELDRVDAWIRRSFSGNMSEV